MMSSPTGNPDDVTDPAARTVDLLNRLQGRAPRSAEDLARDMGVTTRTVRRDIARLRDLGYPVDTSRGPDGGYRLEPGAALPPVRLSSPEAIACTLALQAWEHVDDDLLVTQALAKIRDAMPTRVRWAADAVAATTRTLDLDSVFLEPPRPVGADLLGRLAAACRDGDRITVGDDARPFDPLVVSRAVGRWYLVAFEVGADDPAGWRLLPVDGLGDVVVTDVPATRRRPPHVGPATASDADGVDAWITARVADRTQLVRAVVVAHAPADRVGHGIASAWGTVEPDGPDRCIVRCGAGSLDVVARWLLLLGVELTVVEPPELRDAFAAVAAQAARSAAP